MSNSALTISGEVKDDSKIKSILVVTAADSDSVSSNYAASLIETCKVGLQHGFNLIPAIANSGGNLAMMINQAITACWSQKLDGVFFIHPDTSWDPTVAIGMLLQNKNAIAAPVSTFNGFELNLGEISRLQEDSNANLKIISASTDFYFISSDTATSLCERTHTVKYGEQEVKLVLENADRFSTVIECQEVLSNKIFALGYDLWLYGGGTVFKHQKINSNTDFQMALKELQASEQ